MEVEQLHDLLVTPSNYHVETRQKRQQGTERFNLNYFGINYHSCSLYFVLLQITSKYNVQFPVCICVDTNMT